MQSKPQFNGVNKMLIDTHAHLQWSSFDIDREEVIDRSLNARVGLVINIGFDIKGSREAVHLAERNKSIYASVGIHPHNASQLTDSLLSLIEKLAKNRKVIAIGEIGLDYYRKLSPIEVQKNAFEAQLNLAEKLKLPVIIHNRDAHSDIIRTLLKFNKLKGVMHCFSGNLSIAQEYTKHGFYISIAGPITFPKSHELRETVNHLDLRDLLIETDSPWLAPQSVRGKRNEPAFLPYIAKKIAEIKETNLSKVAERTTSNAKRLFNL
jgi:TatD DNase family protein